MKRLAAFIIVTVCLAAPSLTIALEPPPPPPPVTPNGKSAETFATGVPVPTQITFGGGNTFVAGGAEGPGAPGGIFVIKRGESEARLIKGSPASAYGVAWSGGVLYASADKDLVAYSKWNGTRFKQKKILVRGPKKSSGFSGIAIGPDDRIYTGAALTQEFDHKANPVRFSNTVISVRKNGKQLKTVSRGLRQPWQMTFPKGEKSPIVSVLAQDLPASAKAPDLLVKATPRSNFGFPKCSWATRSRCKKFTRPLRIIPHHKPAASPMGLASNGRKVYLALFGGLPGKGPEVVSFNASGKGKFKPVLTGFVAPVLSVSYHRGYIYAGSFTGIYRIKG